MVGGSKMDDAWSVGCSRMDEQSSVGCGRLSDRDVHWCTLRLDGLKNPV